MTERVRSASTSAYHGPKMENDLSPRKTMVVLVIVVGCFAVLWPKVFYPMLIGSANQHIKPSPIDKATDIRQERPLHLRSELIHPAFRERGRAIPHPQTAPPSRPPPRVIEGRPGPVPGMRPTIGGAGHVVPPSKQGTSSMSVIMPIYTIGIVIFFTYTLMKIIFKKQPEGVGGSLYPPVDPDPHFRKEVFESESSRLSSRLTRENISSKLGWVERDAIVNAMSALLDEVDQEIEARRKSSEVASQDLVNGTLSNGDVKQQDTEEQPTVKVLGMEMTASCEGGKKWSRPDSPVLPTSPLPPPSEPVPPPQEIYLEGALPAQSQLLVADSATEPQPHSGEDPAIVLSGKMTLSVISLDSENGADEVVEDIEPAKDEPVPVVEPMVEFSEIEENVKEPIIDDKQTENVREPVIRFEENVATLQESKEQIEEPVVKFKEHIEDDLQTSILKFREQIAETPPQTMEVEELEKEVDDLIQEAIENIEHREPINIEIVQKLNQQTNEIDDYLEEQKKEILRVEALPEETVEIITETSQPSQVVNDILQIENLVVDEPAPKTEDTIAINEEIENLIKKMTDTSDSEQPLLKETQVDSEDTIKQSGKVESIEKIEEPIKIASEVESLETEAIEKDTVIEKIEETGEPSDKIVETSEKIEEIEKGVSEKTVKPISKDVDISETVAPGVEIIEEQQKPTTEETKVEISEEVKPLSEVPVALSYKGEISEKIDLINEEVTVSKKIEDKQKSTAEETKVEISEAVKPLSEDPEILSDKGKISEKIDPISEEIVISTKIEEEQKPITVETKVISEEDKPLSEDPVILSDKKEISTKIDLISEEIIVSKKIEEEEKPATEEINLEISEEVKPLSEGAEILSDKPEILEKTDPISEEIAISRKIEEEIKLASEETVAPSTNKIILSEEPKPITEEIVKAETTQLISKDIASSEKPKEIITPNLENVEEITSSTPEKIEETKKPAVEASKPSKEVVEILTDDDELGSDEELVEEIEEILYESNEEESEEEIEEESEEDVEIERNTNQTGSSAAQRVNGERSEDLVEESKYTSASGATAAENDISDEELTDNEEVDDEEEIIEIEEEIEDDDYIIEESNDVNHLSGDSEPEL